MLWSSRIALFGLALASACSAPQATATAVCPVRSNDALQFVDVFDGAPEEIATLVPDEGGSSAGYWSLGYVYDAQRSVTVRCKYKSGTTADVKLTNKVSRCDYKVDVSKTLSLACH